ncbi:1054_t:CDS:10, partial [Diversispora eburnea]
VDDLGNLDYNLPEIKNLSWNIPENRELDSGEWLNSILWDENEDQAPFARLTLDMNDPNMLFNYSYNSDLPNIQHIQNIQHTYFDIHEKYVRSASVDDNLISIWNIDDEQQQQRDFTRRLHSGQVFIHHSLPALQLHPQYFKTKFTKSDIRASHRPAIQFPLNQEIRFSRIKKSHKKKKNRKVREVMRKPKELSLKENNNFEEYPPILSNVGMGSLLLNYYRKRDSNDSFVPRLDIGDPVILDVMDESPFMNFGNVERVGQTFPMQEVPSPPSRKAKTTANNRIQVAAYRLMRKNKHHLLSQDKLAKPRKKGTPNQGPIWKLKSSIRLPNEVDIRKMLTPEMICLEESMMVGERHLADAGYKPSTIDEEGVNEDMADDSKLALEESKLAIEQQLAPWITTRNFLNATQTNAMLKLHGEGDPTGKGEGFSFIRISMKDIFLKAGENVQEKLAEIENKPKSGHKYNVMEQWKRYNQEIYRIWNAQFSSLSMRDENAINTKSSAGTKRIEYKSGAGQQRRRSQITTSNTRNEVDSDTEMRDREEYIQEDNIPDQDVSRSQSPTSQADFDEVVSVDGSIGSRANYECSSHRNRALVINRLIRSESGEPMWTKTLVTDSSVINAYVRHRQMIEEQAMSAELLEPTNDEEKNKRLKKRIEDQLAKLRRNQERRQQRKAAREAAKAAVSSTENNVTITNPKDKKTETSRRCGNCGQTGHMKTNKKCPRYGLSPIIADNTSISPPPPQPPSSTTSATAGPSGTSGSSIPSDNGPLIVKMGGNKISIITKPSTEKGTQSNKSTKSSSETSKHKRYAPDVDSTNDRKRKRTFSLHDAHPFRQPVTAKIAPDYSGIIKNPIDLSSMEKKNSAGEYNSINDFMNDIKLMVENCKIYNGVDSPYTSCAYEVLDKAKKRQL